MTPIERFQQLKKKADALQQQVSRAEGALEQQMLQLKEEFGCKTLDEARKKLKQLEKEAATASQAFETAAEEFEGKWATVEN